MKISTTTEHEIKFSVQYFHSQEGGMDNERFGTDVDSLPEALRMLDLARIAHPKDDWIIVADTTTKIK